MYCFVSKIDGYGFCSLDQQGVVKSNNSDDFFYVESECAAHAFMAFLVCEFSDDDFYIQYERF